MSYIISCLICRSRNGGLLKSFPELIKHFNHHFSFYFHALGGICYIVIYHILYSLCKVSFFLSLMLQISQNDKSYENMFTMNNMLKTSSKKWRVSTLQQFGESLCKTLIFCPKTVLPCMPSRLSACVY